MRSYPAEEESLSLVEIGKKKFKKTKRPSAASVIEEAELAPQSKTATAEVEVVLVDPEVDTDGEMSAGLVSLGRVVVSGTQVGVSEEGFVSALGMSSPSCPAYFPAFLILLHFLLQGQMAPSILTDSPSPD